MSEIENNDTVVILDIGYYYFEKVSVRQKIRVPPVEHETLVPLLYAATGSNLLPDIHHLKEAFYKNDLVACIDHKRVKEVRKHVVNSLISCNQDTIVIDNVQWIKVPSEINKIGNNIGFAERKNMINDLQNKLPAMLRNVIDREKNFNMLILE